jgi:hypothetical protein
VHGGYGVFLGLDVGKGDHHVVGLDGKRLHDAPLSNGEARLRELFTKLARHGTVLVVVDQPASIRALPVAVAQASGHQVAYLPGLAMRRIADLHPGAARTDARDAYVIADAARTLPHTLRRVGNGDEALAELVTSSSANRRVAPAAGPSPWTARPCRSCASTPATSAPQPKRPAGRGRKPGTCSRGPTAPRYARTPSPSASGTSSSAPGCRPSACTTSGTARRPLPTPPVST